MKSVTPHIVRTFLLFFCAIAFLGTASDDVQFGGRVLNFRGVTYYLYQPDLNTQEIRLHHQGRENTRIKNIGELKAEFGNQLAFATNGGIFHKSGNPVGLLIEEGQELFPLNQKDGNGNFYLHPNGVFYINQYGSPNILNTPAFAGAFQSQYSAIDYALQSGPMLFTGSHIHPAFNVNSTNRFVRSGVGLLDYHSQQIVFVLSATPVNFHEFATFFREALGCSHALYLDGNISQMYNPDIGLGLNTADNDFSVIISVLNK